MTDTIETVLNKATEALTPKVETPAAVDNTLEELKTIPTVKEIFEKILEEKKEGDISSQILIIMNSVKDHNLSVQEESAVMKAYTNIVEATGSKGDVEKCKSIMNYLLEDVVGEFHKAGRSEKENNKRMNIGFLTTKYGEEGLNRRGEFAEYMKKEFGLLEEEVESMRPAAYEERFKAFRNKAPAYTKPEEKQKINFNYKPDPSQFSRKIVLQK